MKTTERKVTIISESNGVTKIRTPQSDELFIDRVGLGCAGKQIVVSEREIEDFESSTAQRYYGE